MAYYWSHKRFVFLDGPTRCGKSMLVNSIKEFSFGTFVMTGEQFYDFVIDSVTDFQSKLNPLNNIRTHKYICIEDLDFFGGRPNTEYEFASIVTMLSRSSVVIITGIRLGEKLQSMFESITNYEYYEKQADYWNLTMRKENKNG